MRARKKKEVLTAETILIEYNNNKHALLVFYNRWNQYNEIQLTKHKMDLGGVVYTISSTFGQNRLICIS